MAHGTTQRISIKKKKIQLLFFNTAYVNNVLFHVVGVSCRQHIQTYGIWIVVSVRESVGDASSARTRQVPNIIFIAWREHLVIHSLFFMSRTRSQIYNTEKKLFSTTLAKPIFLSDTRKLKMNTKIKIP